MWLNSVVTASVQALSHEVRVGEFNLAAGRTEGARAGIEHCLAVSALQLRVRWVSKHRESSPEDREEYEDVEVGHTQPIAQHLWVVTESLAERHFSALDCHCLSSLQ